MCVPFLCRDIDISLGWGMGVFYKNLKIMEAGKMVRKIERGKYKRKNHGFFAPVFLYVDVF